MDNSPMTAFKSPLHEMSVTTLTDYWNDSCHMGELQYGIEHGAVGATTNPTIVHAVLQQQMEQWLDRVHSLIVEHPEASEADLAWRLTEEMVVKAAFLLRPAHDRSAGMKGHIAVQTNPQNYRSEQRIVEQALSFQKLAPNIAVKVPATAAGIRAAEELTYQGVSILATVSFTVPQVIAVAEAVERALDRRAHEEKSNVGIAPIAVIMVGRLDDWLKVVAGRRDIITEPATLEWAGVAVMKRAYRIFQERRYRCRLLAAAYRNHLHWSELIGGDLVTSIPWRWAKRFNGSDVPVCNRIGTPVDERVLHELLGKFEDFRRAYEPDGMTVEEFATYGATVRTLRDFHASYAELCALIRNIVMPNPDQ
jgi:transaldolase